MNWRAYLDVTPKPLQKPGSALTLHPTLLFILLVLAICMSLDLYPRFWMCDLRVLLQQVVRDWGVVRWRYYQENV